MYIYIRTCIYVCIFIHKMVLRLANIHKQINQDEKAQSETYPNKQTPMLNWRFCFDPKICPHIYQLEGIFISLCIQMAYT